MTDNLHPVDSTYFACCNAIGGHSRNCSLNAQAIDTALGLDRIANLIELARGDSNAILQVLPTDAPLFAVVDLVTALGHLRQAAVLVDRTAEQLGTQAARR